jgi:hypothetical protein
MLRVLPRISKYSQVPATINFHHFVGWLNSANFANGVGQSLDVIDTWLKCLWIWS